MGVFFSYITFILIITAIILPIIILIETFKMFTNIKIIKDLLIEQNENLQTLINLEIRKEESKQKI